jgi:hypothetical protein
MLSTRRLIIATTLGFLSIIRGNPQTNAEAIDWHIVMGAAQAYFATPITENAQYLFSVLPKTQVRGERRRKDFLEVSSYIDGHLDLLERQVLKADRNAVKVAVRLWTIADGGFAEDLASMLGDLIRVNPKMFLEEFREFPWPEDYGDFKEWLGEGNLLCNGRILDGEYEASDEAQRKEMELRIKALKTVKDANLAAFRDECISMIKGQMGRIKGDMDAWDVWGSLHSFPLVLGDRGLYRLGWTC